MCSGSHSLDDSLEVDPCAVSLEEWDRPASRSPQSGVSEVAAVLDIWAS
jgi:hypothetical protein